MIGTIQSSLETFFQYQFWGFHAWRAAAAAALLVAAAIFHTVQIGRASCRERVCLYV